MPDITFTVSTAFLTRVRAAMRFENPGLIALPDADVNAAAREKIKGEFVAWLLKIEELKRQADFRAANQPVPPPAPADLN